MIPSAVWYHCLIRAKVPAMLDTAFPESVQTSTKREKENTIEP